MAAYHRARPRGARSRRPRLDVVHAALAVRRLALERLTSSPASSGPPKPLVPFSMIVSAITSATALGVFVEAVTLFSVLPGAWAESPWAPEDPCRVAILHGQHVQPSSNCHLPPPLAKNPASEQNSTPAEREEIDRLARELLQQSTDSAESRPYDSPIDRSSTPGPTTPATEFSDPSDDANKHVAGRRRH
jgi:hypothetical protein